MRDGWVMSEAQGRRGPRARRMARLVWVQLVASLRQFVRNPVAAFFTLVFPLMFLMVFNLLNAEVDLQAPSGATLRFAQYFTPGIAAFGIITACYTSLAVTTVSQRDQGILKRVRGTPLPAWIYFVGRTGAATVMSVASVALLAGAGAALSGVQIVWHTMAATAVTVVLGAACFCALGLALTAVIPNAESAPALVNLTVIPLLFVSGIFFPLDREPSWVGTLARVFPIEHLANSLQTAFTPQVTGSGFVWGDLATLSLWLVAGLALAVRFFRWNPHAGPSYHKLNPEVDHP
jgi:ABC-2 type transport system permease protein